MSLFGLARQSAVYAFGGLAYKGIALLAVPLMARLLSPSELGLLDAAAITATLLGLVAGLGTEQGVAWLETRVSEEGRLWASALFIVGAMSVFIVGSVAIAQEPLAILLTGDAQHRGAVLVAAVFGSVMAFTAAALNLIRLRSTPARYAVGSFAVVTAETAAALSIAWLVPDPVELMVVGWAASSAVVTAVLLWMHLPRLMWPDAGVLRRLAVFGLPLVPAAIAWLAGDVAIRSALARGASLGTLGEYGIAYRVASALAMVVTGFGVAWYPYIFRSSSADVLPRARSAMSALIAALGAAAIVLSLLSPEVVGVVAGGEYAGAIEAVPFLTGGMVALGLFTLSGGAAGASGSTRSIAVVALGGMGLQIVLAGPLVGAMGLAGGALAILVGYAAAAIALTLWVGLADWGRGGLELGATVAFATVGLIAAFTLTNSPIMLRLAAALGTLVVAVVLVLLRRVSARSVTGPPIPQD